MEIPEGFANVRYVFTNAAIQDPMGFTLGCQPLPGMDAEAVADAARVQWTTVFGYSPTVIISGWRFEGCMVTLTKAGQPTVGDSLVPVVGSLASPGAVAHTAVLVRKQTAAGGRKNRGRMYWPPFSLKEISVGVAGELESVFLAGLQDSMAVWHTGMVGDDIPPWLLHTSPADTPTPITSFAVQGIAATQRRRIR